MTFANKMKILAFSLITNFTLMAGEVHVTLPNDDFGLALVESMTAEEPIHNPEPQIQQEGQIIVLEFRDLAPGKYRVAYISALDPLAYLTTIMETQLEVGAISKHSVILLQPMRNGGLFLPKNVQNFLDTHRENYLTLEATYDGFSKIFELTRGCARNIQALRDDCEYRIVVWDHSYREPRRERKSIFEATFRAVSPTTDPLSSEDTTHKNEEANKSEMATPRKPSD